jgi:dihydrodipicolinate synthase/N-acetylneuraminate lyase
MPTFIATHTKWKTEDDLAIKKEVLATFAAAESGKLPSGVKLCLAYSYLPQGSQCIWEAPSKEALEKVFEKFSPILKKYTEFVQVVQAYPPTMDFVVYLSQQVFKAASK